MSKRDIIAKLRTDLPYLRHNFGVKRIALFGSYAIGKATKKSDVDLMVEFQRPIGLNFIDLAEHLEKILGVKIDILTAAGIEGIRVKKIAQSIKRSLLYV